MRKYRVQLYREVLTAETAEVEIEAESEAEAREQAIELEVAWREREIIDGLTPDVSSIEEIV